MGSTALGTEVLQHLVVDGLEALLVVEFLVLDLDLVVAALVADLALQLVVLDEQDLLLVHLLVHLLVLLLVDLLVLLLVDLLELLLADLLELLVADLLELLVVARLGHGVGQGLGVDLLEKLREGHGRVLAGIQRNGMVAVEVMFSWHPKGIRVSVDKHPRSWPVEVGSDHRRLHYRFQPRGPPP